MNAKLIFKTFFMIVILMLLVLLGMYNRHDVKLTLPPLLPKMPRNVEHKAAIMYFSFFAVGLLTGTILTAGKKGSKGQGK